MTADHEHRVDHRYRPDIDGIRAIAVTSVVLFHAGLFPFRSGFVGVDVFFVISGYLIGGLLLREMAGGRFSFAHFYARRARRILPALIVVVLATCAAGSALLDANELKDVGALGALSLIGASNINFWQFQDYFASDSSLRTLLMTWSLGVEEQFYVIFPLLLLACFRLASRRLFALLALLSIGSFAMSLFWTWRSPAAAFYLLPARAWEIGAGVLVAVTERGGRETVGGRSRLLREGIAALGLMLVVVSVVAFDDTVPFPGWLALLPVTGTVALLASAGSVTNRRLLGARPMVFVGLVSYSWYLWHWPLMSLLRIAVPSPIATSVLGGAAVLSFGLAVLTWRFVETPFRATKHPPLVTLARYSVAMILAIAVPVAIRVSGGFPARLSAQARADEAIAADLRASRCLVSAGARLSQDPGCRSLSSGRPVVVLYGDSHAWALQPGLRAAASRRRYGFEIFARASCPPLLGVSVRSTLYPKLNAECVAYNAAALATITNDHRVAVVVLAGFWSAPVRQTLESAYVETGGADKPGLVLLDQGLRSMVGALKQAGKHVILVDDVPTWTFDPLRIALAETIPLRRAVATLFDPAIVRLRQGWVPARGVFSHDDVRAVIARIASDTADIGRVDAFAAFCGRDDRCLFSDASEPLYFDKDHVSPAGSIRALKALVF